MRGVERGTICVIQIDRDEVAAVEASVGSSRVKVTRTLIAQRPESVPAESAEDVGRWLKKLLDDAGCSARRAMFAAARSEVILKTLEVPRSNESDDGEMCEIVRLQMSRQLTMPIADAVIDWLPQAREQDGPSVAVMAGAIHRERLEWYRVVAGEAGLKLAGVQLSSGGIAALVRECAGPVLAVAARATGTEFVVASGGQVLFSRSVDLSATTTADLGGAVLNEEHRDSYTEAEPAHRVAVEAKRTWMSYRVSQRAEDVREVVVVGGGVQASQVAEACSEMLELPARPIDLPKEVEIRKKADVEHHSDVVPLIGLAVRASGNLEGMDFLNPRQPADRSARRRMTVLASILGLIVFGGAGYLLRAERLGSLATTKMILQDQQSDVVKQYMNYLADAARAEHITRWNAMDADWLGHIGYISERLPDPAKSQADRLALAMAGEVQYDGRTFPGGEWSSPVRVVVSVSGKVSDREITLGLRENLIKDGVYVVTSRGPDVAGKYDFELTARALDLPKAEEEQLEAAIGTESASPAAPDRSQASAVQEGQSAETVSNEQPSAEGGRPGGGKQ